MRFFLWTILIVHHLYADHSCIEQNITKKIFTKKYSYGVVVTKRKYDNNCGIKKEIIDIFQNNKKIDTISGFYDVKLRSDEERDKNRQIIFTIYSGGQSSNEHAFGTIEPRMKKLFRMSGYDISLKDIDKDAKKEIILPKSIFFCISDEFCSHASGIHIDLVLKCKEDALMVDKKIMQQQSKTIQVCTTEVKGKKENFTFANKECAAKNLKRLAYAFYTGDTEKIKDTFKYFIFNTPILKEKFKKVLLEELKGLAFIEKNDMKKVHETMHNL